MSWWWAVWPSLGVLAVFGLLAGVIALAQRSQP